MSDKKDIQELKAAVQDLKDAQSMMLQWVDSIDKNQEAQFAELSGLIQVLIDEQRYSYAEMRNHINELKRQISGTDSEYESSD